MTREEAIRFGENILKVADEITDADAIEFTKMAIETFKQEPRIGHWIWKDFDDDTGISKSYWCSKCNKPLTGLAMKYCGCCGARMVGDNNEN